VNSDERRHRYDMMGVIAYVEERIKAFEAENGHKPDMVILGKLEWIDIMGCTVDENWSVAGVPCVPDLTKQQGAVLT